MESPNMRKKWFEFVAVIRKRMSRKLKKDVTHREAMKEASGLWPKEKAKILNRIKRQKRQEKKQSAAPAQSEESRLP